MYLRILMISVRFESIMREKSSLRYAPILRIKSILWFITSDYLVVTSESRINETHDVFYDFIEIKFHRDKYTVD